MICCFGGTFDPIHIGHLEGAVRVSRALDVDVRLVLSARPSHRAQPAADIEQRLAMLDIASAPYPRLIPDAREARRATLSYTVDTLEALRAEHPDTPLGWVIGRDTLLTLSTWHRWRRVLELTHLVVLDRVGYDRPLNPELQQALAGAFCSTIPDRAAGAVIEIPGTLPEVSATEVRRRLGAGEPVAHLLPTGVFSYIETHNLYGEPCEA
ncbi:MAG: nicotinate-nucleotide adenylyltransferase [Pseudomonadales bacterium]